MSEKSDASTPRTPMPVRYSFVVVLVKLLPGIATYSMRGSGPVRLELMAPAGRSLVKTAFGSTTGAWRIRICFTVKAPRNC
jgi:hypothetical protein